MTQTMTETLSLTQARRVALAAQGFTDRVPAGVPERRHVRRVLARTGLLQIDSVNVVQRAHYLPAYSRLGPYATDLLDRMAYRRPRELFEYWAHEASLVPVHLHPALRWRMRSGAAWGRMVRISREQPDLVRWVLDEIRAKGPMTAGEVEGDLVQPRRKDHWGWNWSDTKTAIEWLFYSGEVSVARRNSSFARVYDVPERIFPAEVLAAPTPEPADAFRELVRVAARALGVAAEAELRDYFRLPLDGARTAIAELVEAGELVPVRVEGWIPRGYLHAEARVPRRVSAATLVSPFDPLMWERARVQRLFGFNYRIEIYVPPLQRLYGYYVLPFLLGDRLVARVDLKADRKAGVLQVPAAWVETPAGRGAPGPGAVAEALAAELHRFAGWLGLAAVEAPQRGDFADQLAKALASAGGVA
ncbi:YcaQ family DNA glycosylase [Dactylosporangium roseum]|uniref:YcaQ family DNA glycosylase n=1 Tax=Dactylosporangium roseum TaxID=47989 RepID=A0ABY5Z848_9ACTN|nr:crosslink repair DNA glycosylase YcaQ family protein [Dactylosporangium roseum]UWZ38255.1 YcaQ family DNA glycosylase [Dactylosporangium roseum]